MHCSDEMLLLLIDGELGFFRRIAAERHVRQCWRCRFRHQQLRDAMGAVAALLTSPPPPSEATKSAKAKFGRWEQMHGGDFWPKPVAVRYRRIAFAAAAASLAGFAILLLVPGSRDSALAPGELLQTVVTGEKPGGALHPHRQLVTLSTTGRGRTATISRVELITDPSRRRFTWRYLDEKDVLLRAAWRSEDGRYFTYSGEAITPASQRAISAEIFARRDLSLESRILEWLVSEPWTPIRLAGRFAEYAGRKGAVLRTSDGGRVDGRKVIRFEIEHPESPVKLILDVAGGAPGSGGLAVIALTALEVATGDCTTVRQSSLERLDGRRLLASSFAPAVNAPNPPRRAAPVAVQPPPPPLALPSPADEARLYYALYLSGALLNGEVSVRRERARLAVEGVVRDDARRSKILEMLSSTALGVPLRLEILTEAEASNAAQPGEESIGLRIAPVDDRPAAWQRAVAAHLRQSGVSESELPGRAATFGASLVRQSSSALSAAWALRRMEETFDEATLLALPEAERHMALEVKLRCLRSVLDSLEAIDTSIQPLVPPPAPATAPAFAAGLFDMVKRLDEELNRHVAGDSAAGPGGEITFPRLLRMAREAKTEARAEIARLKNQPAHGPGR